MSKQSRTQQTKQPIVRLQYPEWSKAEAPLSYRASAIPQHVWQDKKDFAVVGVATNSNSELIYVDGVLANTAYTEWRAFRTGLYDMPTAPKDGEWLWELARRATISYGNRSSISDIELKELSRLPGAALCTRDDGFGDTEHTLHVNEIWAYGWKSTGLFLTIKSGEPQYGMINYEGKHEPVVWTIIDTGPGLTADVSVRRANGDFLIIKNIDPFEYDQHIGLSKFTPVA